MKVFIVTTACNWSKNGFPDDFFGHNIRLVTTNATKALHEVDKWKKTYDGHMARNGFKRKYTDSYLFGDKTAYGHWDHPTWGYATTEAKVECREVDELPTESSAPMYKLTFLGHDGLSAFVRIADDAILFSNDDERVVKAYADGFSASTGQEYYIE